MAAKSTNFIGKINELLQHNGNGNFESQVDAKVDQVADGWQSTLTHKPTGIHITGGIKGTKKDAKQDAAQKLHGLMAADFALTPQQRASMKAKALLRSIRSSLGNEGVLVEDHHLSDLDELAGLLNVALP